MSKLSRSEQETIIRFDAEGDLVDVYTADASQMRRFDKLVSENPEQFKAGRVEHYADGSVCGKRYKFPKRFLTVRSKDRELSDEQRAALAERMRNHRIYSTAEIPNNNREI